MPDGLTKGQKYATISMPLEYVIAYSVEKHISLLRQQFIDVLFTFLVTFNTFFHNSSSINLTLPGGIIFSKRSLRSHEATTALSRSKRPELSVRCCSAWLFMHRRCASFQNKKHFARSAFLFWRRHPDLNRGIKVLQTSALPLGYDAVLTCEFMISDKIPPESGPWRPLPSRSPSHLALRRLGHSARIARALGDTAWL